MSIYGIELLLNNVEECRANMLELFASYLDFDEGSDLLLAAKSVLQVNVIHGDALSMRIPDGKPIAFAEWGYLGKGKFMRRDFQLDTLTGASAFSAKKSLFADVGRHDIFVPSKVYPTMNVRALADAASQDGLEIL